jgi:hypothetical protein
MKLFAPLALIASIVAAGSAAAAPASLYAPAVTRDGDALRVRGAVCRSGPRPTVDMRHLFVTPLDESGRPIAERTAAPVSSLTAPNARCAFYSASAASQARFVEVCAEGARDRVCVRAANAG